MIARFLSNFGGYLALAALVGLLWWRLDAVAGQRDRARLDLGAANGEIELLELDASLKAAASIERAADTDTLTDQARELENARNHPGDDPATRRLRSLCGILRQQSQARFDANARCVGLEGATGAGDS